LNKPTQTGEDQREKASKNHKRCPAKLTTTKKSLQPNREEIAEKNSESTKKYPTKLNEFG